MKIIALASWVVACCVLSACTTTPPLKPAVVVNIVAKPKEGVNKPFERVAVYDAAPTATVATGQFEQVDYSNVTDIVVWLEPINPTTSKLPPDHHVYVIASPQLSVMTVVSVGDTIEFRNPYPKRTQSLYSVSDGNEFEFPSIASGSPASYVVQSEGLIEVLSDPAKPPSLQIYAAPSSWAAVATRPGQSVTFYDVPPGEYRVVTWHARLPGSTSTITLRPDEVTETTVTIGVNALSESSR